jgi:hypothetical protein
MCNTTQLNQVRIVGAFDCNPAGHGIAMLYKFGAETGICQNKLTAASLEVVGLFPSDLQWLPILAISIHHLLHACSCRQYLAFRSPCDPFQTRRKRSDGR